MAEEYDNPFMPLRTHWLSKITKAMEIKRKEFQNDADEAEYFFNGGDQDMFDREKYQSGGFKFKGAAFPTPTFGVSYNKVSELVQLFGPAMYSRNPARKVAPRQFKPPPPMMYGDPTNPQTQLIWQTVAQKQNETVTIDNYRATLIEDYISWTPGALDLRTNSRRSIDEALIYGAGCMWVDTFTSPGSDMQIVGSFYDTIKNLAVDPDFNSFEDAKWIAKRCVATCWELEAEYGLPKDTLKGSSESHSSQARSASEPSLDYKRAKGETNDLCVYWKVWSKMGMGSLLSGCGADYEDVEQYGQFCYLVVTDSCEYPLNLPPTIKQQLTDEMGTPIEVDVPLPPEEISQRVQWPTPFWMGDAWPVKIMSFHWVPGKVWPMSHFKPVMGLLKFLNWLMSFLASKITKGIKDLIAIKEGAEDALKKALVEGTDYEIITFKSVLGSISEQAQFLQHPPFHMDVWKIYEMVMDGIEKGTGLSELAYGESSTQSRSAVDAQVKGENLKIRPDDMAECIEFSMSELGWMEAFAAKWHCEPERDIAPVLGPDAAMFWEQQITALPPEAIIHGLEFKVEAGSIRKKNFVKATADADRMMQQFGPFYQNIAMTQFNVEPWNGLVRQFCDAYQIEAQPFILPPMQPPMMPPPQEGEKAA